MTTTPYLEFEDQATGANNNTWGDVADANFAIFELAIARVLGLATTGGTTTLTSSQNRYPIINVTGVLASNATIAVKTQEKNWIVINNTTGAYSLTVKTSAGTGKTIPRGRASKVYCDGTNVLLAREQAIPSAQAGGTVDVITATFEPAFIAAEIQDGTIWMVEAAGANTVTTPTFNPDTTGALTIKKFGGQALAVGDIRAAGHKLLLMYDASGGHVELLNPVASSLSLASTTEVLTGTDAAKAVTPDALAALWEKGSDEASSGTVSFDEGGYFHITGTTTITDIDFTTAKNGRSVKVIFDGILTLTHHATTLILPGGANITTAAGDRAEFVQDSTDNVICLWYQRANGTPIAGGATAASAAEQETGSEAAKYVAPATQHHHQSAAKFWVKATANSTTIEVSYNMTSWADTATGRATGTIATDFSSVDWCGLMNVVVSQWASQQYAHSFSGTSLAAGTFEVTLSLDQGATSAVTLIDPIAWFASGHGDQ